MIHAILGALADMLSQSNVCAAEIATLRLLGSGLDMVRPSLLTEALLPAAAGGIVGGTLAWFAFRGSAAGASCARTPNFPADGQH